MIKQFVDKSDPIPRYLQVKQILQERIRSGKHDPGGRLPGERDLAQELQVSQMTVNKAILALVEDGWLYREHGKGTFVRADFRPPLPAVLQIGVVSYSDPSHALDDIYFGALFRGMQSAVVNTPVGLSLLEAPGGMLYPRLCEARMDGFLLTDLRQQDVAAARRLYQEGRRLVALSASWPELEIPRMDCDNYAGVSAAVSHLIDLGHRRIAGVFTLMDTCHTQRRLSAYQETLRERAHCAPEEYTISSDSFPLSKAARQQVRQLLHRPSPPTAFFCGGYHLTLEVMQTLREEGRNLPEDCSVVGFEDPISAAYLTPPLTTVRQPLEEMGRRAVGSLVQWLLTQEEPSSEMLPTSLIWRGSTAPCSP